VALPIVAPSSPWCLFLDRDGVINTRITDGYVRSWTEFHFEPGALAALRTLARWAPRIVIVTNQQGIGKGLMSLTELEDIHGRMRRAITEGGGRIDAVQFCPHLATDDCDCRKPRPGMATQYLAAHPEVDGSASVLVGDTASDIEMGRRLGEITGGCVTVRIDAHADPLADLTYPSLSAFAAAVCAHSAE
jgi:D-glycero-D-manno-heptose 1,7-bisphosphate phosphatase